MATESARRNSSTWRYFPCRDGLTRPCWSEMPSATQGRVVLGEQPLLGLVVAALRGDLLGALGRVQQRLALLGHPQLVGVRGGLDVPVGERLVEQLVEHLARVGVVGDVRLGVVVRRELEVATGLEVDVPQLDATPPRLGLPATTAGRERADEVLVVEDLAAQSGQRPEKWFGHAGPLLHQGGDHDDEDQPTERDRDDESAVPGVHASEPTGSSMATSRVTTRRSSMPASTGEDGHRREHAEDRQAAAADQRPAGAELLTDPADERRAERRAAHEHHQVERHHPSAQPGRRGQLHGGVGGRDHGQRGEAEQRHDRPRR